MMTQSMHEMSEICPPGMFPGMEAEFMNISDSIDVDGQHIQLRTHPSNCQINIGELGKKLLEAARNGDLDEVCSLVHAGAPFTTDWLGATPLHYAAQFGHTETVRTLLENGCSKDARTKIDRTALHVAAQEGFLETCKVLLDFDCEIDPQDMLKMTPLHWAAQRGHKNVIDHLLNNGADVLSVSKFDKTPVDIAQNEGLHEYAPYMKTFEGRARPKRPSIPTPSISQPIKIKGAFGNKRMKVTPNGLQMQRSMSQNSNSTATPKFTVKEEIDETSANVIYEKVSTPKSNNTSLTPKSPATAVVATPSGKKLVAVPGNKFLLVSNTTPSQNGAFKNGIQMNGKLKPISVSELKTPVRKFEILSNGARKPVSTTPISATTTATNVVKRIVINPNGQNVNQNALLQQKNNEIKSLQDEIKRMKKEIEEYRELIISKDLELEAMKKQKRALDSQEKANNVVVLNETNGVKDEISS